MARAICGRALFAWPASSRVATQVVRIVALYKGSAESRAMASAFGGFFSDGFHVRGDLRRGGRRGTFEVMRA